MTVVFAAIGLHGISAPFAFGLVLLYDLLAFGSQVVLGEITDRLASPKSSVLAGLALCAVALGVLPLEPWAAAVAAGLGNALFHVGAGAITLYTRPGKAMDPGLFVAPGALGLGFGMWISRSGGVAIWPYLALLFVAAVVVSRLRDPVLPYRRAGEQLDVGVSPGLALPPPMRGPRARWIIGLLLVSIAIRSLVGMGACHAAPETELVAFGVPLVAFGGKALGGVISDHVGWIETSLVALLGSAPLIAFGAPTPWLLLVGLLLFQMTMPVTLVAILQVQPARPAFAFGLACLALVGGAVPTFFHPVSALYGPAFFVSLIVVSAIAVFAGLRALSDRLPEPRLVPTLYG